MKHYSEEDHSIAERAEWVAVELMRQKGFTVTHLPHGRYGPDLLCESDYERFFIEVENRLSWWEEGEFPFPSVHVPGRRQIEPDRLYMQFSRDLQSCLVVFPNDLATSEAVKCPNNAGGQDEMMRDVDVHRALQFSIDDISPDTFAVMNACRVREIVNGNYLEHIKRRCVGRIAPYGIPSWEWAGWLARLRPNTGGDHAGK